MALYKLSRHQGDFASYEVTGNAFSWDTTVESLQTKYFVGASGQKFSHLADAPLPFEDKFVLEVPGGYRVDGTFLNYTFKNYSYEFTCLDTGKLVAQVNKKLSKGDDSCDILIAENGDNTSILCACIILDCAIRNKDAASSVGRRPTISRSVSFEGDIPAVDLAAYSEHSTKCSASTRRGGKRSDALRGSSDHPPAATRSTPRRHKSADSAPIPVEKIKRRPRHAVVMEYAPGTHIEEEKKES